MHMTSQAYAKMKKRRAMWKFLRADRTETFLAPASGPAELSIGAKGSVGSRLLFWRASLASTCSSGHTCDVGPVCVRQCEMLQITTTRVHIYQTLDRYFVLVHLPTGFFATRTRFVLTSLDYIAMMCHMPVISTAERKPHRVCRDKASLPAEPFHCGLAHTASGHSLESPARAEQE